MVATLPAVTTFVVIVNVADVAPAATVTEAGTVAALMLPLVNVTTAPPAGAGALSLTVPVLPAGPVTVPGFSATDASAGATIWTTKPSLPPTFCGWAAAATGKSRDPV